MGAKISIWLYQFPRKLAVHPGVGVAQLTITGLANSYGILAAAVQPGTHLLLNNLNIIELEILWGRLSTLYFLDSCGSQQPKERIITGAGLGQTGKSYLTIRTGEIK